MFTSPAALPEWACHIAEVDPRPGGRVYLWWEQGYYTAGVFTAVTPDRHRGFHLARGRRPGCYAGAGRLRPRR